ncbi:RNA-directed DNA polymerase, eukaryota [Tanacetum coccineum]
MPISSQPSNNFQYPRQNISVGAAHTSFATALSNGTVNPNIDGSPAIVLDDTCIMEHDFSRSLMGKIKNINALSNLYFILDNDGVNSWFVELKQVSNSFVCEERLVWVLVEGLPIKAHTRNTIAKMLSSWGELVNIDDTDTSSLSPIRVCELAPWTPEFKTDTEEDYNSDGESKGTQENDLETGFTPIVKENNVGSGNSPQPTHVGSQNFCSNSDNSKSDNRVNESGINSEHKHGIKLQVSRSILEVIDELIKMNFLSLNLQGLGNKAKQRWIQELNIIHRVNLVSIQETKMENMDLLTIKKLWGNVTFYYAFSPSIGYSRDYALQDLNERRMLWDYFRHLLDSWDGECVLLGDINEVRFEHEQHGSLFNSYGANTFNNFINLPGLIDLPLEGYSFTWSHKSASKMSKLDRFLISEGLLVSFPYISALCLDKHLSDHRPILLRELNVDYGPTPFCFFQSWFSRKGFDKMVEDSWKNYDNMGSNSILNLMNKLRSLKSAIKLWLAEDNKKSNANTQTIISRLTILDKSFDQGTCNDELLQERSNLFNELLDLIKASSLDLAKKPKSDGL